MGTPIADPEKPLEVLRTVHSFDPCLACAVHLSDAENKEIVLKFPSNTFEFTGATYVGNFVQPNVYFHIATAYGILRNRGVALGKPDYLGGARS